MLKINQTNIETNRPALTKPLIANKRNAQICIFKQMAIFKSFFCLESTSAPAVIRVTTTNPDSWKTMIDNIKKILNNYSTKRNRLVDSTSTKETTKST